MSKARDLADFISTGSILSDGTIESTEINGVTADASELNVLDGITASTADLNNVAGINTSVQAQLDGKQAVVANVSSTEIGYLDGVTSALQTQLDNISVTSGSLTKSFASGETASITLAQAISPAPVVSATKEVPQVGISSKGAWDVNATASNYELHNTAYATTLTPSVAGYNLSNASDESKTYSYGGTDNYMQKIAFSIDGTKFYLTGNSPLYVYQYNLTTAWDISTASAGSTFDVGTDLGGDISSIAFKTDGYKMYVSTYINDRFVEYDLSTAWDVSTASSPAFFSDISNLDTVVGMWFKPDGTRFYVTDFGSNHVKRFDLSTAWDITTSSYNSQYSLGSGSWRQLQFKPDGTAMYLLNDDASEDIREYTLSTAWDITTASLSGVEFEYLSEVGNNVPGFYIRTDNGATLYIMDNDPTPSRLRQYNISSDALVLGTGSFASTDVGKRIVGNGGDVTLTSTAGAYDTTGGSAFTDSSTIASGSWSMRGLKSAGATDGITIPSLLSSSYDVAGSSSTADATYVPSGPSGHKGFTWKSDGTKFYVVGDNNREVYEFPVTTPYDISTASSSTAVTTVVTAQTSQPNGVIFNNSGTQFAIADNQNNRVVVFTMSTAWDITTASQTWNSAGGYGTPTAMLLASNGSVLWVANEGNNSFYKHPLSTANDFTTMSYDSGTLVDVGQYGPAGVWGAAFNGDGTKVFIVDDSADKIWSFDLSTAYDFTTIQSPTTVKTLSGVSWRSINFSADGTKMHIMRESGTTIEQYNVGSSFLPTSQYHIATTNSGGQINTAFWTDINTMVADQDAGDGTVHYAVSTDDRTTWSVIKEGSGVRPIVRDNSGTWQYNSDVGSFDSNNLSLANYANDSFTFSNVGGNFTVDSFWSTDGTKLFIIKGQYIAEIHLSTAYDLSTAAYNDLFDLGTQDLYPFSLWMNSIGERAYVSGGQSDTIYQYGTSTGFDLGPFSYTGNSVSVQSQDTENRGIWFGPENATYRPTKMFMIGGATNSVYEYSMSSPGNLSTISYSNKSFSVSTQQGDCSGLAFSADGTVMFVSGRSPEGVHQYSLSTAWDISTASYSNVFYDTTSFVTTPYGVSVSSNGEHLLIADETSGYVYNVSIGGYSYGTSTTWANSTTNDEFYALQQALGATAVNRMDKTQLDAVTDPNHYTLGNTLDLAIALRMDTASASTPTADGVTINYDAASLNQGAVLGTDYDYDFPNSTTVRVTSNAAQNLKIRVV